MQTIQDRLPQKQLLEEFKIPTAAWMEVSSVAELTEAERRFPRGFVLKQRRFGYDGYGTFIVRGRASRDLLKKSRFGFIAEELIPFKRELAVSFVRSARGELKMLPLVESVQRDSRCFSVQGPLKHARLARLKNAFQRLMQELDYQGVLAVELFETKNALWVNELAPRVHNSAHYSQNALTTDQFEYHLRAGLGLALPKVELVRPGFAMINLLGEGGDVELSARPEGHLHWYGKSENRPGRKLGHINVLDSSGKRALTRALKWRKDFKL
jgi:5-(carboxyamino)imidazole ribonucleotide synthase